MPRLAPAQSVTKTRGTKKANAASTPPKMETIRQDDDYVICPLCCDDVDETDKSFYPCPCGYQVCLFCYMKIKNEHDKKCPICRKLYGEPVDAPAVKRLSDERAAEEAAARLTATAQRSVNGGPQPGPHQTSTSQPGARPTGAAAMGAKLGSAQQRRGDGQSIYTKREEPALPTGATWAAAGPISRHHSEDIERPPIPTQATVDDSAWPSLADSATAPAVMRLQRQDLSQSYQSLETACSEGSHRRSTSASSASADSVPSPSSSSQDLNLDQGHLASSGPSSSTPQPNHHMAVPPHLMDVFASAQVSSTVHGVRHNINVPLPVNSTPIDLYPEVIPLKANVQQAMRAGTMSSTEAAAHLVAFLRHKESDLGGVKSQLAAGKPPPGFSAPVQHAPVFSTPNQQQHSHLGGLSSSGLNTQDPSVSGPPLGRYNPIQPPMQHGVLYGTSGAAPGRPGQATFNLSPGTMQAGHSGTYSMWSGLPGIELSVGSYGWQGPPGMQPGGMPRMMEHPMNHPAPSAAKTPPPGFGPAPYAVADAARNGLRTQPNTSLGYNTLQAQLAGLSRPPPPGMSAYRPQLGM